MPAASHWCQKLCRHWIREACTLTVRLVVLHCPLFHDCVWYLNASFLFSLLRYMAHYWPLDHIWLAVHANHAYSHLKLYEVNLKIPFLFKWSYRFSQWCPLLNLVEVLHNNPYHISLREINISVDSHHSKHDERAFLTRMYCWPLSRYVGQSKNK